MRSNPMARPLAKTSTDSTWSDIPALLMLGTGMLLYLALISYVPGDLPNWVPFSPGSTPNSPAQNFVGPVGAVVAGWHYFFLGVASFLVAALLLLFGAAKLFFPSLELRSRIGWMILFVLSGCCLAQLQPWFLHGWRAEFNAHGPGGIIGVWLGVRLFRHLLGQAGSAITLMLAYGCALILMTGLHPVVQVRKLAAYLHRKTVAWQEQHAAARLARASQQELLDLEKRSLAKEQRKLEKQLKRKGVEPLPLVPAGEAAASINGLAPDEFASLPPPKFTDNSVSPVAAAPPVKKQSLSELLESNKAARHAAAGGEALGAGGIGPAAALGDVRFADYQRPGFDLLDSRDAADHQPANEDQLRLIGNKIVETLDQFGIKVSPGDITKGPTITRYEVYPAKGVRVDKIVSLERDLARATRAERINILAPIPGKDTVGIEIANSKKVKVTLRELLEGADWAESKAKIPLALGKDVYGKTIIADLAAMPHCLVAGATGSGKSVCINSIISSILYKFTPEELRFVMIDPKVVEMQIYNDLPHLVVPVVTDPKRVLLALRGVIDEMEKRYKIFAKTGVRNITGFNARPKPKTQAELDAEAALKPQPELALDGAPAAGKLDSILDEPFPRSSIRNTRDHDLIIPDRMPYIVVIVDELADLMQTAPADVESAIARITQMARAAGIHMILATQTPRADVITGVIKANVPSRIAFQVASKLDSRVILDENGADRLLGQGDMLYLPPGTSRLVRAQGVLVTDEEISRLVAHAHAQGGPPVETAINEQLDADASADDGVTEEDEELVDKCLDIMRQEKKCSTSMLQRRLRLGYTRAARIVDILEKRGIVGPENGARGREILVDPDTL
jgi:S-DNA-T family DNA segregation ATPase FtsK/SpoIIIE